MVESKSFKRWLEPKELETDCGKLSDPAAPKCCPTKCRKCNGGLDKKKRNVCHWLKVGKNGRREKCCSFFTICKKNKKNITSCYNTKRVCRWTSKVVKTFKKSSCKWQRNKGGRQRRCCSWTVKCFGAKCFDLRKKCQWKGKLVTKVNDHGCRWVVVGKNVRRQRCCRLVRKCVGKKCTTKSSFCKWTSEPIKLDWITKCRWIKKGSRRFKRCCNYFKRCVGNKCTKKLNKCNTTDRVTVKRHNDCHWRRFKKGRRQRCCKFSTFCNKKNLCRKLFRKCRWVGKVVWWTSNQICKWQRKTKLSKQKRCCKYFKKCIGKKCKVTKTLCDWRGKSIYSKLINNCKWVPHHKEGSRQFCCKHLKVCKGKTCKVQKKKCGFTGKTVQWKTKTTCRWAKFKDYKQRKCCYRRIRCVNHKNCRVFRESCKYLGPKVTRVTKRTCKFLKEENGQRKKCCTFVRYCYGKHCKDINKRCKTGKLVSYKKNAKCFFEGAVKGWLRKVCCAKSIKCLNRKCKTVRRLCKVTTIRKRTIHQIKFEKLRKLKIENEKKKRLEKLNLECNCFKQESQNFKISEEKRQRVVEKSEKCKKSLSNLKVLLSKSRSKIQQNKLKAKIHQREKRCKNISFKVQSSLERSNKYKALVGKKNIACSNEKRNYKNYLITVSFEEKKFRAHIRKQERIERAILIKKYESDEELYKFQVIKREKKIQKKITIISQECKRTFEELQKVKSIVNSVDRRYLKVEKRCKLLEKKSQKNKKSLKKSTRKSNKRPTNKLRLKKVISRKLKSQKAESRLLSCKKKLAELRTLKRNSDKNFQNASKNHNNCSSELKKSKTVVKRVETREKTTKKDLEKLLKKPAPKKVSPPKPKPARPAPRPQPPRRRRGRGDVWLQDRNGNYVDVNVEGTFKYLVDNKNKIQIDTQFSQLGLGSVISGVVLKARNVVVRAERNGEVTVNGRAINEKSAIIEFTGNSVRLQKLVTKKPGLFIIRGLREEKLSFRYFKNIRSYDINAESKDNAVTGLFRDPHNPRNYILAKKDSKFRRYLKFDQLDESEGNEDQQVEAQKCCQKIKNAQANSNCRKDYYRTDVCFADEYLAEVPLRR